jgi:cytochrome c6
MLNRASYTVLLILALFFLSRTSLAQSSGADTFNAKCQVCHGAKGLGDTPFGKSLAVPPYNAPDIRKMSDADLTVVIKKGKNKMPGFSGQVTDSEIKEVLKYIHTLQK